MSTPTPPAPAPPVPPQVTLRDGLLTIVADNSTLGNVLRAVQRVTGASIEYPGGSGERIYFRGGPGAPRDVLASLLNGSRYDYILLGSPQQPKALTRVILTVRQRTAAQPVAVAATPARSLPPPPADTTESEDTSEPPAIPPPATAPQPQPAKAPAALPPPGMPQPGQPLPGQPAQPGLVRTPEQMLQELQKLQQQQNQQLQLQQQLNQQNGFSR